MKQVKRVLCALLALGLLITPSLAHSHPDDPEPIASLGIEEINVLKDLGGGRFTLVDTYGPYSATNRFEYYKELTIAAESGQGYKASIRFYVTNASGEKVYKTAVSNVFIVK